MINHPCLNIPVHVNKIIKMSSTKEETTLTRQDFIYTCVHTQTHTYKYKFLFYNNATTISIILWLKKQKQLPFTILQNIENFFLHHPLESQQICPISIIMTIPKSSSIILLNRQKLFGLVTTSEKLSKGKGN